ncbi:hypothetical protein, secreted [gut metagenome]|uniref:DUF3316 domain-containing protein n=1 Tax=gut metagenome TaxID=749906 RepID=J9H2V2_9ZZZZ
MQHKFCVYIGLWLAATSIPLPVLAQEATEDTRQRTTAHQWLYGVGHNHVLDTYLSPLTYQGLSLILWHRSERTVRWNPKRITIQGSFGGDLSYLKTPVDNDKAWDGNFTAAVGWYYHWHPTRQLQLAAGGFANLGLGFTYLLKNSNNPAQARAHIDLGCSGIAEQQFRLWNRPFAARLQMDLPLIGAMFSPNFGQSYYEIFSLGHYDHNICLTHPFNAPTVRWEATLHCSIGKATVTAGYLGDILQSKVNNLKHHAWKHYFVIGYVRRLQLVR